jgi:Tol biopolymer transport system component
MNSTKTRLYKLALIFNSVLIMVAGCLKLGKTDNGVTFIASRGSSPPAQSIVWSPTNENKILVTAYETPAEPAEVYILDIQTKQENVLVKQLPAYFFEAKWTVDGKRTLILAENNTKGFEPSGWWTIDIEDKSSKYFMPPSDIAWSPDGKTIVALRKEKEGPSMTKINILLIDPSTKAEDLISTFDMVDSSWGISWSLDGKYIVFSLGYQGASNLYILNVETRQVVRITQNGGSEYPIWSPQGNVIAYTRNFPENTAKTYIYLASLDGKCEIEVPNLENVWSPTWSPDGKKLGYLGRDGIYFVEIDKVFRRNIYQDLCG